MTDTLGLRSWDYADLMLRASPQLRTKDEIQVLPWADRERVYRGVDELLAKYFMPGDGSEECVLLENHLSIVDGGLIRTFPHEAIQKYNAVGLAVIEATPAEVVARRQADAHRDRHVGTTDEVAEQQAVNRREAALIAQRWCLPVLTTHNSDRARAASELAAWVDEAVR